MKLYPGAGTWLLCAVVLLAPPAVFWGAIYVASAKMRTWFVIPPDLLVLAGCFAFAVILPMFVLLAWTLFTPALVIDGSTIRYYGLQFQLTDVRIIEIRRYLGIPGVALEIADPAAFLAALSNRGAFAYRGQFRRTGNAVLVPRMRGLSLERLRDLLQQRWDKSHLGAAGTMVAPSYRNPISELALTIALPASWIPLPLLFASWGNWAPTNWVGTNLAVYILRQLAYGLILSGVLCAVLRLTLRLLKRYLPHFDLVQMVLAPGDLLYGAFRHPRS